MSMAVFEPNICSKVTLDDTTSLTCNIEAAHNVKDHTEYIIRVQRGPIAENNWTVSRRYSDFVVLDAGLVISGIALPLPPKKMFGNKDREFIAARQQGLQNYLNTILAHNMLASCILVKEFLDPDSYSQNLQEAALQHISMFFRSEPKWEVLEPLPDTGWRIRKKYFMIKDQNQPKLKFILSWSSFGPDKYLPNKDLQYVMKLLPTFQHPYIYPVQYAVSNETCGIAIRTYRDQGTLRDVICRVKPKGNWLKKYGRPKVVTPCQFHDIRVLAKQVLEATKYLHDKGLYHGHLHAGNIIVEDGRCRVLDVENSLLGLPSVYRAYFTQFKKIKTVESIDVYCFGHLLYEMTFGVQLNASTCDNFSTDCAPELRSVMESILTTEACKNGLPTINGLLQHPLFASTILPPNDRPTIKIPSKLKESLRDAKTQMEKRLSEEQRVIHQYRKLSKAQAFHMSDDEKKKRRKSKMKQLNENGEEVQQSNGEISRSSPAPNAPSAPSSTSLTSQEEEN